ncbi:hypothetical protein [Miltoncostaea oceani]|jgi:hypothetical protein|uniref:hypothetical protein n=1 Tax=Miltoncostaea oceani TaxID=2843216 RepID=UPI001C3E538A|nr:hypothetical protein [Miltoncostaea oceani]
MPSRRPRPRCLLLALALVAGLVLAAPAAAAPPVVSGADGDRWSTAPTYTVTAGTPVVARARFRWSATNGQEGDSDTVPFTITLTTPFAEGPASLTVTQRPRGLGLPESTTRTFVIDRTPPAAVALTVPASAPAGTEVPVSWSAGEAGARYTLRVRTASGAPVQGPVETTATSARVVPLEPGSYVVVLVQTDAAGNAGPEATAPLSVRASEVPAFTPPVVPVAPPTGTTTATPRLPSTNAGRLAPRRASRLSTRRPVLSWARGPRGTRLYNVQVFRVYPAQTTASGGPRLRKVSSSFPKVRRMRTAALARGACYVWRVWPYGRSGFTAKPLGLSNFCVAPARPGS